MLHKASDLSIDQKTTLESLLGRSISDRETVSIRAFEAPQFPDGRRQEILEALNAYFTRIDAQRLSIPDKEAEEVINEALRSTRPHYGPVR